MQTTFAPSAEPQADPDVVTDLVPTDESGASALTFPMGSILGPVDRSDIYLPRLSLVQKTGDLSKTFPLGTYVLNKEHLLTEKPEDTLNLVVVSIRKSYRERLPFKPNGPRPKLFASLEEVVKAGLWVEWRDHQPPPAEETADALILIQKPDALTSLVFGLTLDDKQWAMAVWTLVRTAYVRAAKKIFSAAVGELSKPRNNPEAPGLLAGLWTLSSKLETVNGNEIVVPILTLPGRTSDKFRAEYIAMFGNG